jgi:hypothetical protein
MRPNPSLRLSTTRHEEKEQKLREFALHHLANLEHTADPDRVGHVLIVARSVESPVVTAITSLDQEIAAAGLSVRMILAQVDHQTFLVGLTGSGRALACEYEARWARHPRLIEAHEQLVLGPETCWMGDCMRRDPSRCDAYENYVEGCGEAAGCAIVSFERLWFASEPLAVCAAKQQMRAAGSH